MIIRVGKDASVHNQLLWTPPPDSQFVAKILADEEHFVGGTFCRLVHAGQEYIWSWTGEDDPSVKLGVTPRFSLIIPMLVKEGDTKTGRNVRFPQSVLRQVEAFSFSGIRIPGAIVKVSRTDTESYVRYALEPTGKYASTSDFDQDTWVAKLLDHICVVESASEVRRWLREKGVLSVEDF
jgi:hypothetical protein